jgi:hypothetical protein
MHMEHVYLRENIESCEAQIAASEAVLGAMTDCLRGELAADYVARQLRNPRRAAAIAKGRERLAQFEVTRGLEIQPVHETSPDTPQGLMKVATDGERNGRLAWVPGC